IDRVLESERAPRDLPDKFVIVLDGGGDVLRGVASDIRIDVRTSAPGVAFLGVAGTGDRVTALGAFRNEDLSAALYALLDLASCGSNGARRMREVLDVEGVAAVRMVVASFLMDERGAPPSAPSDASLVGFHAGIAGFIGIGLPFGSGDSYQWNAIADIAERY